MNKDFTTFSDMAPHAFTRFTVRAKQLDTDQWVYGGLIAHPERPAIAHYPDPENPDRLEFTLIQPDTVGQCTGIQCRPPSVQYRPKGDEPYIFEGDIVECMSTGDKGRFVVRWRDTGAPLWLLYPAYRKRKFWHLHQGKTRFDDIPHDNVTILGNVHDDPELAAKVLGEDQ